MGQPSATLFEYSIKISSSEESETWLEGTFDDTGHGMAIFSHLPLGLNLIQLHVNGIQVRYFYVYVSRAEIPGQSKKQVSLCLICSLPDSDSMKRSFKNMMAKNRFETCLQCNAYTSIKVIDHLAGI